MRDQCPVLSSEQVQMFAAIGPDEGSPGERARERHRCALVRIGVMERRGQEIPPCLRRCRAEAAELLTPFEVDVTSLEAEAVLANPDFWR